MKIRHIVPICLGLFVTLPASAQFAGSDNFASDGVLNTSLWTLNSDVFGTATFTETASGLKLTSGDAVTGDDAARLEWNAQASNAQDWSVGLNVYRPTNLPLTTNGSHVEIGLFINSTNPNLTDDIPNDFFSLAFDAYNNNGPLVLSVFTSTRSGGGTINNNLGSTSLPGVSGVVLGISYSAATSILSAGYSLDNGVTFSPVSGTNWVDTTPWASSLGTFQVSILGASNDFSVSESHSVMALGFNAIPEPSTYALLAGLGTLGLACWRRRRKT